MHFNLTIKELTFSDGTKVPIPPRGVIAIVGPNNVGKTAAFREILEHLKTNIQGNVIRDIQFALSGTKDDLIEWLGKTGIEKISEITPLLQIGKNSSNLIRMRLSSYSKIFPKG